MKWDHLDGNVWTIATEAREKANAGELVLPDMALGIINELPRFESNPFVFAGRQDQPISASHGKEVFDKALAFEQQWQLHDLRRTARSLLSRAGIRPHIAERVLGHAIKGVEGVYDRHEYREEKAHALNALAGLIQTILIPPGANVVPLKTAT
jgi:integrase